MFNNKRYGRKRRDLKLRKNLLGYKEIRNGASVPQKSDQGIIIWMNQ